MTPLVLYSVTIIHAMLIVGLPAVTRCQNITFETSDAIVVEALDSAGLLRSKRQLWQAAPSAGSRRDASQENDDNHMDQWPPESMNDCRSHIGGNGICVTPSVCDWIQQSLGRPAPSSLAIEMAPCRVPRGQDSRTQRSDFVGVCCPGLSRPPPAPTQPPAQWTSRQQTAASSGAVDGSQTPWWLTTSSTSTPGSTYWWQRPAPATSTSRTTSSPASTAWWQTTAAATPATSVTQWWQTTQPAAVAASIATTAWWQTTTTPTTVDPSGTDGDGDGAGGGEGGGREKDAFYSCGTRNFESDRIVGGQEANKGEFPWIAGLYKRGRHFCGGSLIDETHVLTAAHCVARMSSYDVSQLTVRLGDHDKSTPFESAHQTYKVARVVRHKGFTTSTLYDDIALITLVKKVQFTDNVRPICLVRGSRLFTGRVATVAGWGSLREGGRQPNVLMKVTIKVWENEDCAASYGRRAPGGIIGSMLCAGREGKDSCSGDSGGPLMMVENRLVYQIGVVSWGIGCGKANYPGVYTRITSQIDWLERNRKKY